MKFFFLPTKNEINCISFKKDEIESLKTELRTMESLKTALENEIQPGNEKNQR